MSLLFPQSFVKFMYTLWPMDGKFFILSEYFRATDMKQDK